ncbi:MAG: HAD family hydrolase [Alphaproteobacteria bacterium]|nr:HAD family hydrolase [Alphaproteobacteria bacterium]
MTVRIAMWSGPRNLSTALMRSFEARGDCAVVDEPLYACYLATTGLEHPMRDAVIASQSTDWRAVVGDLVRERPEPVAYQKHMAHHLLDGMGREWLREVHNALLIRHPARVLASYARRRERVEPADLGFLQQVDLLDGLEARGLPVVVVDSADILRDPAGTLSALCGALGVGWTERMLSWAPGPHASDGVWAPHWYAQVWASTGFGGPEGPVPEVPAELEGMLDALLPSWERLAAHPARVGRG